MHGQVLMSLNNLLLVLGPHLLPFVRARNGGTIA